LGVFLVSEQVRWMFGSHESLMNNYYTRANTVGRHLFRSCRLVLARDGRHVGWCRPTNQHQPDITSHYRPTQRPVSRNIIDTLRMVCGAAFTKLSGVRLSVCRSICPSRHSPAARRTAANAISVTFTAAVTQACILFAVLCRLSVCLDGPSDVGRQ